MAKEIWNLGRVCGFSAYELYLRYVAVEAPGTTPATEKEWLASMLTMGNSMLLRIGTDNVSGVHYRDIPLPSGSKICAANTIFASYFAGSGYTSSSASDYTGFATRVTDYGPLIENTSESHPSGSTVPPTSTSTGDLTPEMKSQISEYLKIIDGIVIQPGTWSESALKPPYCDFKPTFTSVPNIRISFKDKVNVPFFILLTGFSNRLVVQGVSGTDTATGSQSPADGDFLGPWVFPWAAKIVFSVPPAFIDFASSGGYIRKFPDSESATEVEVDNASIIDFAAANPITYYYLYYNNPDPGVPADVTDIGYQNTSGSVIATYQQSSAVAPSLYGLRIDSGVSASYKFYPLDVAAPGTVKIFQGPLNDISAEAVDTDIPHNVGMYRDDSLVIYQIDKKIDLGEAGRHVPVSDDRTEDMAGLYTYNTRYLWFCADSSGAAPTQTMLEDIKWVCGIRAITGYFSQKFIDEYCVDYAHAVAACANGKISDGQQMQLQYVSQIVSKYGAASAAADFKYFFQFFKPVCDSSNCPGQYGMFYPVNIHTKQICIGVDSIKSADIEHGFNFSDHPVSVTSGDVGYTLPQATTDIMGSYWNHSDGKVETDQAGIYVFENHPILNQTVFDYIVYWKPEACVPKAPIGYNNQFVQWLSNTPVTDIYSSTTLGDIGVNSDYFTFSAQRFMEYLATGRDMSLPISAISDNMSPVEESMYLFTKNDIESIADDASWTWTGKSYMAGLYARAYMSRLDFYRMAEIRLLTFTVDGADVTVTGDQTDVYTDSAFHRWAATGYSGNHQTKAISLIDDLGSPLPTGGGAGTITADKIKWDDLLDALSQNKTIDLLASIVGQDYIQLPNIRLYVSSTEPTGVIPEGSLGIGWGGIKVYTSGAWTAYT